MAEQMEVSSDVSTSLELSSSLRLHTYKIIVIGDAGVGKTCLTYRLCANTFPGKTEATIGVEFGEKVMHVGGETVKIQLWDTAGQERFRKSMVEHYYRNAHAIVFVYDVTSAATFHSLPAWMEECRRHSRGHEVPRVLVGNKCDLKGRTRVSVDLAQTFARSHHMPLFQVSVKSPRDSNSIEEILLRIVQQLRSQKPLDLALSTSDREGKVHLKQEAEKAREACGC